MDTNNIHNTGNPWIGLKSYSEGLPLYGRDDEIVALTNRIVYNVQTVIYGRSGIGKSSILRAGIFPKLRENGILPILMRLEHNDRSYTEQIIDTVMQEAAKHGVMAEELVPRHLDADGRPIFKETLWEFFHRYRFTDKDGNIVRPLVAFDQFEEIFTLAKDSGDVLDFFVQVGDLLNHTKPTYLEQYEETLYVDKADEAGDDGDDAPRRKGKISKLLKNKVRQRASFAYGPDDLYHLVFTLREDYLSFYERHTTRIPLLKQNRYCLQSISDEQAAQIILKPRPGLIDKDTATLIIQKVTGRTDFAINDIAEIPVDAAVLSLYLSRLYDKKDPDADTITPDIIEKFGDNIIEDFYTESMSNYPDEVVEYIEQNLLNDEGHRENVSVYAATHKCKALTREMIGEMADVHKVLRVFSYNDSPRIELIHDILCPVVAQRKAERARRKLAEAEERRQNEEREALLRQQVRMRRRYRAIFAWCAVAVLVIASVWAFSSWMNVWEYSEYYTGFVRQNGWPVGVGEPLSKQERSQLAVYYKLSREGRSDKRPFSSVEVCSGSGVIQPSLVFPLADGAADNDKAASRFARLVSRVRSISFIGESESADAPVSREIYHDKDGNLLFGINYMPTNETEAGSVHAGTMWALYVDNKGLSMNLCDNGADRMKVYLSRDSIDKRLDRLETKYMFYDPFGNPRCNNYDSYGYRLTFNADRTVDSLFHLDQFAGEKIVEKRVYAPGTMTSSYSIPSAPGSLAYFAPAGYAMAVNGYDGHGNIEFRNFYNVNKQLQDTAEERRFYDSKYRLDSVSYMNKSMRQYGYSKYRYADDRSHDLMTTHTYAFAPDGSLGLVESLEQVTKGNVSDTIVYRARDDYYRHHRTTVADDGLSVDVEYLDREGRPVFDSIAMSARVTTRVKVLGDGRKARVTRYYDASGALYTDPADPDLSAVDSLIYDNNGNLKARYEFGADGHVITAMGHDYLDGSEVARYAISLDGVTPIRCPQWEIDGLSYYKLRISKNSDPGFNLSYLEAESEYPRCNSLVITDRMEVPVVYETVSLGEGWTRSRITKVVFPQDVAVTATLPYVHILDLDGTAYKAGLRDGDILMAAPGWTRPETTAGTDLASLVRRVESSATSPLTVMRYNRLTSEWQRITINVPGGNAGFEVYPVSYSADEFDFFITGLKEI